MKKERHEKENEKEHHGKENEKERHDWYITIRFVAI